MQRDFSRRVDQRGGVSLEMLAVLPVFVVIFVGIFFSTEILVKKQQSEQEVRRCAFQFSEDACASIPRGCEAVLFEKPQHQVDWGRVGDVFDEDMRHAKNLEDLHNMVRTLVEEVVSPILRKAFEEGLEATLPLEVAQPELFGGGKTIVSGHLSLACNTKKQKALEVALQPWSIFHP